LNDYLVATFIVVWVVMLVYVAAIAMRTSRLSREVELLTRLAERRSTPDTAPVVDGTE